MTFASLPLHPSYAHDLQLTTVTPCYRAQGKHKDAEYLYNQAIEINQHALGPEYPDAAKILNNMAGLLLKQARGLTKMPWYAAVLKSLGVSQ